MPVGPPQHCQVVFQLFRVQTLFLQAQPLGQECGDLLLRSHLGVHFREGSELLLEPLPHYSEARPFVEKVELLLLLLGVRLGLLGFRGKVRRFSYTSLLFCIGLTLFLALFLTPIFPTSRIIRLNFALRNFHNGVVKGKICLFFLWLLGDRVTLHSFTLGIVDKLDLDKLPLNSRALRRQKVGDKFFFLLSALWQLHLN